MERDDKLQSVSKFLEDQEFNKPQPKQLTPLEKALIERRFTTLGDRIVAPLKNLNVPSQGDFINAIKSYIPQKQQSEQIPQEPIATPAPAVDLELQKKALETLANKQIPSELNEFAPELEERDKLKKLF